MCAKHFQYGNGPAGRGGDFERVVIASLVSGLPSDCVLVSGAKLWAPASKYMWDYDIVVCSPFAWVNVEVKLRTNGVFVEEDALVSEIGNRRTLVDDGIFSRLTNKSLRLKGILAERAWNFPQPSSDRVYDLVVVGPESSVVRYAPHASAGVRDRIVRVDRAVQKVLQIIRRGHACGPSFAVDTLNSWKLVRGERRREGGTEYSMLGGYRVTETIREDASGAEYRALDDWPYEGDVLLREFPIPDSASAGPEAQDFFRRFCEEVVILRRLRHPSIRCVTGHFVTGGSLVEVSDWVDGAPLEARWDRLVGMSFEDLRVLVLQVCDAIQYCHDRSVFHRNVGSHSVWVDDTSMRLIVSGFSRAKDASLAQASTRPRDASQFFLTPPESVNNAGALNPRLEDIFQLGVLAWQVFAGGRRPWSDAESYREYCSSSGALDPTTLESLPLAGGRRSRLLSVLASALNPSPPSRQQLARAFGDCLLAV